VAPCTLCGKKNPIVSGQTYCSYCMPLKDGGNSDAYVRLARSENIKLMRGPMRVAFLTRQFADDKRAEAAAKAAVVEAKTAEVGALKDVMLMAAGAIEKGEDLEMVKAMLTQSAVSEPVKAPEEGGLLEALGL